MAPGNVTREAVLKAIPKKKVKGNAPGPRECHGSHFPIPLFSMMPLCARVLVCPLTCLVVLSVGPVLQMVRVSDKILLRF